MGWPGINPGPPIWQEGGYPPVPLSFLALFTRTSFRLKLLFKDTNVRRRQRRENSLISGVVRISERSENFPASLINKWLVHGPIRKDALDSIRGWKLFELVKLQIDGSYPLHYESCMSRTLRTIEKLRLYICYVKFSLIFTRLKFVISVMRTVFWVKIIIPFFSLSLSLFV